MLKKISNKKKKKKSHCDVYNIALYYIIVDNYCWNYCNRDFEDTLLRQHVGRTRETLAVLDDDDRF